jgi:uridine kinase
MTDRAFVIGLSGVPGSGKTTLTQLLRKSFGQARVVFYDAFQTIVHMPPDQVRKWFAAGADPNDFALTELVGELTRQTQIRPADRGRPLVIFETPFGRMHRATGAFIDFLVWIDTPLDVALSRATLAFLAAVKQGEATEFIKWQTQYMQNYPTLRPMYVSQRERIISSADLVVDGNAPPPDSAATIVKALAERGVTL